MSGVLAAIGDFFVNPWLLAGLAIAAAPVIIHLLNRRRFRVHEWAAMDFLLRAMSSQRRRLKFEDLLLLLLRIAILMLLVVAVSRPLVTGYGGWREDERVVVLDDSFSMDLAAPGGTVFDVAREAVLSEIRDAVGSSTAVTLVRGTRPEIEPRGLRAGVRGGVVEDALPASLESDASGGAAPAADGENGPEEDARASSAVIDSIRGARPCDLPLAFDRVLGRFADEAQGDKSRRLRAVVIVSDFRSADWIDETGAIDAGLRAGFEGLRSRGLLDDVRFRFVDVGQPSTDNAAITGFRVEDAHVLRGVSVRIVVEVTNFAKTAREGLEGEVELVTGGDAALAASRRVALPVFEAIPPGGKRQVEVSYTFDEAGELPLRARIQSDALHRDDEAHLVVLVRESLRVVVVDGEPGQDRFSGESGYLLAAIAPRGGQPTGLSAEVVPGDITKAQLTGADVLLVLNRAELTLPERDVVGSFLAEGGGVGYFLGERVDAERYRELADSTGARAVGPEVVLFPAILDAVRAAGGMTERSVLRVPSFEHPAFKLFRGLEGSVLDHVLFTRYFSLRPVPGAVVVAAYSDAESTPAVVELAAPASAQGAGGRIVLFNTTADRGWSDWPTDPSFPVLLQEWLRHLAPRRAAERQVEVGRRVRVEVEPGEEPEIVRPDGSRARVVGAARVGASDPAAQGSEDAEPAGFDTEDAGFYVLSRRAEASPVATPAGAATEARAARTWYAARRGPGESDLEAAAMDRLRAGLDALDVRYTIGRAVEADAFARADAGEVWRWFAWATGLILLVELVCAWWFGRR